MHRQALEQGAGIQVSGGLGLADELVVIIAVSDRLLEDRRVRGDATQPIIGDQPTEFSALQQVAADEIEPYRLPMFMKRRQTTGHDRYSLRSSCCLAAAY